MRISSGYKFWNYAKKKYIVIKLEKCPNCNSKAEIDINTPDFGKSYIICPKCGLRSFYFYTDTNHRMDFGIETASKEWNERRHLYIDENYWEEWSP